MRLPAAQMLKTGMFLSQAMDHCLGLLILRTDSAVGGVPL